MTLLTVNAGSSSVRLAAFALEPGGPRLLGSRRDESPVDAQRVVSEFLHQYRPSDITAVVHRVVHGGEKLVQPCVVDAKIEQEIERLVVLAPLHNPLALEWIRVCRGAVRTGVPQLAVFDTAFYSELPEVARAYALPGGLVAEHGLRRFGFHGLAHAALGRRWRQRAPEVSGGGRVISLQLGAGCSITATCDGRPVDTSMGFSPLEGLVMATRSGDIDPGILLYLQRVTGMAAERLERLLNEESGLLGVSGVSGDMRCVLRSDEPAARLAVALYCYRARKYVGAYLAALGGADAILFGGGIGENAAEIRARILAGMGWAGIDLDTERNAATVGVEARVSSAQSRTAVWVMPVDEAKLLAEAAAELLRETGTGS